MNIKQEKKNQLNKTHQLMLLFLDDLKQKIKIKKILFDKTKMEKETIKL